MITMMGQIADPAALAKVVLAATAPRILADGADDDVAGQLLGNVGKVAGGVALLVAIAACGLVVRKRYRDQEAAREQAGVAACEREHVTVLSLGCGHSAVAAQGLREGEVSLLHSGCGEVDSASPLHALSIVAPRGPCFEAAACHPTSQVTRARSTGAPGRPAR